MAMIAPAGEPKGKMTPEKAFADVFPLTMHPDMLKRLQQARDQQPDHAAFDEHLVKCAEHLMTAHNLVEEGSQAAAGGTRPGAQQAYAEKSRGPGLGKIRQLVEEELLRQHHRSFSEQFKQAGITAAEMVTAYRGAQKQSPAMTASQFLRAPVNGRPTSFIFARGEPRRHAEKDESHDRKSPLPPTPLSDLDLQAFCDKQARVVDGLSRMRERKFREAGLDPDQERKDLVKAFKAAQAQDPQIDGRDWFMNTSRPMASR